MPPIEEADRWQKALYWEYRRRDRYGRPQVLDVREIDVRWNVSRAKTTDPQGNTVQLSAEVVSAEILVVSSILWLGELEGFLGSGSGSGDEDTELHEVFDNDETKDLKGRFVQRNALLRRYRDTLPEIVTS